MTKENSITRNPISLDQGQCPAALKWLDANHSGEESYGLDNFSLRQLCGKVGQDSAARLRPKTP